MAKCSGLLNRRSQEPRVRIPPSPPKLKSHRKWEFNLGELELRVYNPAAKRLKRIVISYYTKRLANTRRVRPLRKLMCCSLSCSFSLKFDNLTIKSQIN